MAKCASGKKAKAAKPMSKKEKFMEMVKKGKKK